MQEKSADGPSQQRQGVRSVSRRATLNDGWVDDCLDQRPRPLLPGSNRKVATIQNYVAGAFRGHVDVRSTETARSPLTESGSVSDNGTHEGTVCGPESLLPTHGHRMIDHCSVGGFRRQLDERLLGTVRPPLSESGSVSDNGTHEGPPRRPVPVLSTNRHAVIDHCSVVESGVMR